MPFTIQKMLFVIIFILDHIYYFPLIISAIIALRKKNSYGLFLLIAFAFYFLSNVEWILSNLDIIPFQLINYLNIKGISFIIIMILGLGYKFKIMKNLIVDYKVKLLKAEDKLKNKVITDATKRKIEKIKEFLKENFHEIISRDGLASAVDMSPDHLGRIFKKDTGIKLSDYINNLRIKEAVRQLKNKETKIIDIAFDVGFESLRNFNKVFYHIEGKTPSEYRKT
jgi:AraC-like DNA-binding protein